MRAISWRSAVALIHPRTLSAARRSWRRPAVDNGAPRVPAIVEIEIQGERITSDVVNRILPHLSDMQQEIFFLLMKGCGVRETGREVGITHPAVIKHRKKIARVARELHQASAVPGQNGVAQSN